MPKILMITEVNGERSIEYVNLLEMPEPGIGEVRYHVQAFALNRADLLYMKGNHYSVASLPSRIGLEACGVIDAVGLNVHDFKIGDKITSIPFHNDLGTDRNVAGEFAITPSQYLMKWPDNLSSIQATSVTMQYLTAYYPLCELAKLGQADTLLVTAGSSSAGIAAIQIGKLLGARVIAETRSHEKIEKILNLGADSVIIEGSRSLEDQIMEITDNAGVNVVYDPIGGESIDTYSNALAFGAKIFIYGNLAGPRVSFELLPPIRKKASIYLHSLYNHVSDSEQLNRGREFLIKHLSSGALVPIIDSVFTWDKALDAYKYLDEHKHIGKVVVSLP